ncbi:MAG: FAD binding domain-containing protein, partial [Pseudomonadota bacterium]
MLLPRFKYHDPLTMEEACQLMGELKEKAKPLAGGTDLLVNMKKRILSPENVVSLGRIDALREKDFSNSQMR